MLGQAKATQSYIDKVINEAVRLPLFQLVHGDAAVTTYRWEDVNYKGPDTWKKKDLLCILWGEVPIWNLDLENYEKFRDRLIESYNEVH